ncbi:hypothetical protein Tco_0300956 [Tanacetum coccineum]|uniref:Uncharacterized protein n=1 Tax=Tanacetum coccineum TaxID=301880 RepID=A0ABQ5DK45_9ASTR
MPSPYTLSPGHIADSNPEEDKEDPEEDHDEEEEEHLAPARPFCLYLQIGPGPLKARIDEAVRWSVEEIVRVDSSSRVANAIECLLPFMRQKQTGPALQRGIARAKNQSHKNQIGGTRAHGVVHTLRGGETDQNPNNIKDEIEA